MNIIIPRDKGGDWRRMKYIEYHKAVPPIEPKTYCEYIKYKQLSEDDSVLFIFYNFLSYSTVTAAFIFRKIDFYTINQDDLKTFWKDNKKKMIFTSARKYVALSNVFLELYTTFIDKTNRQPMNWLKSVCASNDAEENYELLYNELYSWKNTGRFSIELFIEGIIELKNAGILDINIKSKQPDYLHGNNITTGLLNICYLDKEADDFDKTKKISPENLERIHEELKIIQKELLKTEPEEKCEFSLITPKLCSFRNLFKGRRYGGFHHDRQLEQLRFYELNHPELKDDFIKDIFDIRKRIFSHHLLGELNNWNGVRPERTKLFIKKGYTGVEKESLDKQFNLSDF